MPKRGRVQGLPYNKREAPARSDARLVNLKNWRKFKKMTIATLAEAAEMSVGNLGDIENLRQGYSPEGLLRLAKALGITTGALLTIDPLKDGGGDIWTLWSRASAVQRQKIVEIAETITRPDEEH